VSLPDQWLTRALLDGDLELAQAALDAGAKPNWRGPYGERPLTAAARWGKGAGLIKGLLERGARVDDANATAQTPLMVAAAAGRVRTVRILLEAGADVDRVNRNRESALTYAVVWRKPKVVELLLGWGADAEQRELPWSPLMYAANEHDAKAIRLLLAHGANPRRTDQWDRTAHDIAAQPRYGRTQRQLAVTARQREAIRLLKRASAPPKRGRSSAGR
jgi:ankyrin repeat protein